MLNDFQVSQPFRAYSRIHSNQEEDAPQQEAEEEEYYQKYNEKGDEGSILQDRIVVSCGNGDVEPNGVDCYDDAGNLNCNQCYKFEYKKDLQEETSKEDLEVASSQGTMTAIVVNGVQCGQGSGNIDSYASTFNESGNMNVFDFKVKDFLIVVFGHCYILHGTLGIFSARPTTQKERKVESVAVHQDSCS